MRNQNSQQTNRKALSSSQSEREVGIHKKELSKNLRVFFEGYIISLLADARNSLELLYGSADYTRDCITLKKRMRNEGFSFVTRVLPHYMDNLLSMLEKREVTFSPYFKTRGGRPTFLRRLTEIVTNEANYSSEIQAKALMYTYNICVCGKKLRGQPDEQIALKQWGSFCDVDKGLSKINFDDPALEPIIASMATQWWSFARDLTTDDDDCVPRPGPGSTVENTPKHMRYAPHVLFESIHKEFPYEEWFYSHPYDLVDQSRPFLQLYENRIALPYSVYSAVPKTYEKWRGICKEFNEVQYVQQALRRLLTKAIKRSLSKFLPLDDQSVHAKRALASSVDRRDATIDESEASDRIARILVAKMTVLTPDLQRALMAVSTTFVKPPAGAGHKGVLYKTEKFAPMGSAVCFPIMSLLHLFLIRAIILTSDMTNSEKHDFCKRISVYGDDVILPSSLVPLVYEWLPRFGLKINQTKSFVQSHFRESCGCHAYKGYDITPVYVKYTNFSSNDSEMKSRLSLLSVEEQLFSKDLLNTARFIRDHVTAKWPNTPYVVATLPVAGFKRPPFHVDLTDFSKVRRADMRWNRHIQSYQFRLPVLAVEADRGVVNRECEALLRQYCSKPRRDVNLELGHGNFSSCVKMDDWVRRLDDKTIRVYERVRSVPLSALHGHACENMPVRASN